MVPAIDTEIPGLELRELEEHDVAALHALIQRNAAHLTKLGDYDDVVSLSTEQIAGQLAASPDSSLAMGVYLNGGLIGRVDLNAPRAGNYVLGYWIDERYTSKGFTTAACRAIIQYVQSNRGAEVVWAGVKESNHPSVALLERLGFTLVERLPTHLRFRYDLGSSEGTG